MKKVLFVTTIVLGAIGIGIANSGNTTKQIPAANHSYIIKDTVPSDTTKPKDSSTVKF